MKSRIADKPLGQILCDLKLITQQEFQKALDYQRASERSFVQSVLSLGSVTEADILLTLTGVCCFPYLELASYEMDPALFWLIPESLASQHSLIPTDRFGNSLMLVMADPTDRQAVEAVEQWTHSIVQPSFVSSFSSIQKAIEQYYRPASRALGHGRMIQDPARALAHAWPERRNSPRRSTRFGIVRLGDSRNRFVARTKDLSMDGFRCVSDHLHYLSSKVSVQFDMLDDIQPASFECEGDVVRVERLSTSDERGVYEIVICFRGLSREDKVLVTQYVQEGPKVRHPSIPRLRYSS